MTRKKWIVMFRGDESTTLHYSPFFSIHFCSLFCLFHVYLLVGFCVLFSRAFLSRRLIIVSSHILLSASLSRCMAVEWLQSNRVPRFKSLFEQTQVVEARRKHWLSSVFFKELNKCQKQTHLRTCDDLDERQCAQVRSKYFRYRFTPCNTSPFHSL